MEATYLALFWAWVICGPIVLYTILDGFDLGLGGRLMDRSRSCQSTRLWWWPAAVAALKRNCHVEQPCQ